MSEQDEYHAAARFLAHLGDICEDLEKLGWTDAGVLLEHGKPPMLITGKRHDTIN